MKLISGCIFASIYAVDSIKLQTPEGGVDLWNYFTETHYIDQKIMCNESVLLCTRTVPIFIIGYFG